MKNQKVRMAPEERTCAPAERRESACDGRCQCGMRQHLIWQVGFRTVEAKEADCECWVWPQNAEEDGYGEDAGGHPCDAVAVLTDLRLDRGERRGVGRAVGHGHLLISKVLRQPGHADARADPPQNPRRRCGHAGARSPWRRPQSFLLEMPAEASTSSATAGDEDAGGSELLVQLSAMAAIVLVVGLTIALRRWAHARALRRAAEMAAELRRKPRTFSAEECADRETNIARGRTHAIDNRMLLTRVLCVLRAVAHCLSAGCCYTMAKPRAIRCCCPSKGACSTCARVRITTDLTARTG